MRLKDKGDSYAEKAINADDDEDYYETLRNLFNAALAEGRRAGLEEAAKICDSVDKAAHSDELDLEAGSEDDDLEEAFINGRQHGAAACEGQIRALLEAK